VAIVVYIVAAPGWATQTSRLGGNGKADRTARSRSTAPPTLAAITDTRKTNGDPPNAPRREGVNRGRSLVASEDVRILVVLMGVDVLMGKA
jgi:hypothetical protein